MLPPRILIVSATRDTAVWLSRMLECEGGEVEMSTDATAAFRSVWDAEYDVIISELGVPGIDGRDLYMAFRNTWPELTRRMVFVCGQPSDEHEEFAARARVPLVRGPVDVTELLAAVRSVRDNPPASALAS
jgi:DNA-binding response OmpR family regulator